MRTLCISLPNGRVFVILAPVNRKLFIIVPVCLAFASSVSFAAENPPSEASVKQLLEVSQVRKILDDTMKQIDAMMNQMMEQLTRGQPMTPKIQKDIDQGKEEAKTLVKEILDWNKLEPMYVRIYQKSFTQPEIDNLIAMYKTPGGQALLNKMPVVMQNSMAEMQQLMQPLMERVQRKQQELAAKIQAEHKKGG